MTSRPPFKLQYPQGKPSESWVAEFIRVLSNRDLFVNNALVRNEVLSDTFAIDSTGTKTITINHELNTTPARENCMVALSENTAVDDWVCAFVKVTATSSTTVTVKVRVTTASATVGATAKVILWVKP